MCGIAGIFNYAEQERPVDADLLRRMTRSLAHRGPDAEGLHIDGPIGLGHRRLSIVDLSPTGAQPMHDPSGRWSLVYNGEFYDHARFRPGLQTRHTFRGPSDTETLLYLLAEQGPKALEQLSAIFGFAFWDKAERRLLLGRDALGVKQVYLHDDGKRLLFASEIKALLQCELLSRRLDPLALNEYLHFHTPLFGRTFFQGIRVLEPGTVARVDTKGVRLERYWQIDDFSTALDSPDEAIAALREKVAEVVRDQLMADVPVGAFFSGGIDSTAVASFAKQAGARPKLFGVHFSDQGVIDERPFQEEAARALGLPLELITLDGADLPERMQRLAWHQDQPVIGAALLGMDAVSELASRSVKVCLGGQAADELFGGYARYAIADPVALVRGWMRGRIDRLMGNASPRHDAQGRQTGRVGGNVWRQLADPKNLRRLARNASHLAEGTGAYFEHFANVPEQEWRSLFAETPMVSRAACRALFDERIARSGAPDAATAAMHWDQQTYLPGLFQQDDRMSMAHALESRVPLADPRLVKLAFRTPVSLKMRGGASKWLLRQAVADVLPEPVLNRRKVGFDTPVERWMRQGHPEWLRDLLLSRRTRERGLWNTAGLRHVLESPDRFAAPTDMLWKVVSIETWARAFLDGEGASRPTVAAPIEIDTGEQAEPDHTPSLAGTVQELREMGPAATLFRVGWELRVRSGLMTWIEQPPAPAPGPMRWIEGPLRWREVAEAMRPAIPEADLKALRAAADEACHGRILAFGKWTADHGDPIDWHLNPVTGRHWPKELHWSRALAAERGIGDVKHTWEVGRFPQAFTLARAAAFFPEERGRYARALAGQIRSFLAANPWPLGVHWASGQELVFRLFAWLFACSSLADQPEIEALRPLLSEAFATHLHHVELHRAYAEKAVNNNHLISELCAGHLRRLCWPDDPASQKAAHRDAQALATQAETQFYEDGGYLQQSYTYQRVAMQTLALVIATSRERGWDVPSALVAALDRSITFLHAHLEPSSGLLPNHGPNDGSMPVPITTRPFPDFRPVLQLSACVARGERLFESGSWDESACWWLGPAALQLPLRPRSARSSSFPTTGHHVLRGTDAGTFATFRCGSLRHRFGQPDMLHVDLFHRGRNLLIDAGSYQYNASDRWHRHFLRTSTHNTVTVDDHDQMLHHRRFKLVHLTRADLTTFHDEPEWALAEGRHHGFRRHPGEAEHRRAVLAIKDGLWVVVDHVAGYGVHDLRLHWLLGDVPLEVDERAGRVTLAPPDGPVVLQVVDEAARPLGLDVVRGRMDPPRGWQSRFYGERLPTPSVAVRGTRALPATSLTLIGEGSLRFGREGEHWWVESAGRHASFTLHEGRITAVETRSRGEAP